MLTGCQIREARLLLKLSHSELARKIGTVRPTTINKAESDDARPPVDATHLEAIQQALEALGIVFGSGGPRLREQGA